MCPRILPDKGLRMIRIGFPLPRKEQSIGPFSGTPRGIFVVIQSVARVSTNHPPFILNPLCPVHEGRDGRDVRIVWWRGQGRQTLRTCCTALSGRIRIPCDAQQTSSRSSGPRVPCPGPMPSQVHPWLRCEANTPLGLLCPALLSDTLCQGASRLLCCCWTSYYGGWFSDPVSNSSFSEWSVVGRALSFR